MYHLIEVDCLNTFQHHPLLDKIENNQKKVFILSGTDHGDKRNLKKLKILLNRNNLFYKSDVLSCLALYRTRLFQQSVRYDGSTAVMIFPSAFQSTELQLQEILSKLQDKKLNNELDIIPVVFDDQCEVCEVFRIRKPLMLTGGYNSWWVLLNPIFGRSIGDVQSMVVQTITLNETLNEFKTLLGDLKETLSSANADTQIHGCRFAQEQLDIKKLVKIHSSNHLLSMRKQFPSDPICMKSQQSSEYQVSLILSIFSIYE